MTEPTADLALDRRRLLRRAAVAGAAVWVAPQVVSVPAAAQTGTPTCAFDEVGIDCIDGSTALITWTTIGDCPPDLQVRIEIVRFGQGGSVFCEDLAEGQFSTPITLADDSVEVSLVEGGCPDGGTVLDSRGGDLICVV